MRSPEREIDAPEPASARLRAAGPATEPGAPAELSVIVVNHNVKDFLLQCLRSLEQAMRGIDGEVLVVDNHSSDGSVAYLAPLFPAVSFIPLEENVGFGRACNLALRRARGEYVLFLNPDTLLQERTLAVMLEYMRGHPEVGMSGCKVLNPDGTFQLACRRSFPTPWASFCKVFGLQRLFPRSRLFAQYNQTWRNPDEGHLVDAISGSFMFARGDALRTTGGFDPSFFMYGEDLDLCYRMTQEGWKIAYVPQTSLIHFKGESTRRSSLDRVKVFYQAMELFVRKHHGRSSLFLLLLRAGIGLRSVLAYANRHRRALLVLLFDLAAINAAMLVATRVRVGSYLGSPPYAFPDVIIALSATTLVSMLAVGEYFESPPSVRKAFVGLMVNFFLFSSLTYFFRDFGFGRGVLIMTIASAIVSSSVIRAIAAIYDKSVGKESDRRIAIVGMNEPAARIVRSLQSAERRSADLVGIVSSGETTAPSFAGVPVLGEVGSLGNLIAAHRIDEVVFTDDALERREVIDLLARASDLQVRFHVAFDYEEIVAARIIDDVAGIEPTVPQYNIRRLRYRIVKRAYDLAAASLLLTIGLPLLYLVAEDFRGVVRGAWRVLRGKASIVGLYPIEGETPRLGKLGMTGLAHISRPERLSRQVIRELNEYYVRHYGLSLDFDILIRSTFRRVSS